MAVFALNQRYELVGLGGVVGITLAAVDGHHHCLAAYNLAGGRNQRHQTGVAAYHRYQAHSVFENIFGFERLQLSHHIGVHTAGNFGILHQFIGFGEAEIFLDGVACVEQRFFVACLGGCNSCIDLCLDFGGNFVGEGVEFAREVVFIQVVCCEALTCTAQCFADFADGLHVYVQLDTEFVGEEIHQFDSRSSATAAEPPDIGIEDVYTVKYGHNAGCKAVAGCAMRMEVNLNLDVGFELGYNGGCTRWRHETGHILECNNLGAESFHGFGFLDEVFVGENLLRRGSCRSFFAEQFGKEALGCFLLGCILLGVYSIAYGSVGHTAKSVDHTNRLLDVVYIIERVKDTHNI